MLYRRLIRELKTKVDMLEKELKTEISSLKSKLD